jgi:hypothetical protein
MPDSILEFYRDFKDSRDTLRIYQGNQCVFKSDREMLAPLVEFITTRDCAGTGEGIVVLDKIMGNAAALLCARAGAVRVYSPLGSELAAGSLQACKIQYFMEQVVPFIIARNGKDMCPMEKLSLNKSPDEFYEAVKNKFLSC